MNRRSLFSKIILYLLLSAVFISVITITVPSVTAASYPNLTNVVVFVEFTDTDHTDCHNGLVSSHCLMDSDGANLIKSYFDGETGSLKSYLNTISYGQCLVTNLFPQISGDTVSSIQVGVSSSQSYSNDAAVLSAVTSYLASNPFDGTVNLDNKNTGYIDNVTIILCDGGTDKTQFRSHAATYGGGYNAQNGTGVYNYTMICESDILSGLGGAGVISHEFLHTIGYTDLYYDYSNPVGTWDIMSSASTFLQYPLAYQRYHVSGWLADENLKTVTADGTYTLTAATKSDSNDLQALILKTPYSNSEFFVIEYRVKEAAYYQNGTYVSPLDSKIPGTGFVIYRINTNTSRESNFDGAPYYLYVFRDGDTYSSGGESATGDMTTSVLTSGSTRGTEDLNAGLNDGAITYSDNANSGIVITAGTVGGDTASISVHFTQLQTESLWSTETVVSNKATLASCSDSTGNIYLIASDYESSDSYMGNGKPYVYSESGTKLCAAPTGSGWSSYEAAISNGYLYILYTDSNDIVKLVRAPLGSLNGTWETVYNTGKTSNLIAISSTDNDVVCSYISDDYYSVVTFKAVGTTVTDLASITKNEWIRNVDVVSEGGNVYVSYLTSSSAYLCKVGSSVTQLCSTGSSISPNVQSLTSDGNTLYFSIGAVDAGSAVYAYSITGGNTTLLGTITNGASETALTIKDGTVYAAFYESNGKTNVYVIETGGLSQHGNTISTRYVSSLALYAGDLIKLVSLQGTEQKEVCISSIQSASGGQTPSVPEEHIHSMIYHSAVSAACTTPGNVSYYECSSCGKMYSDASGTSELSSVVIDPSGHSLTYHKAVSATCTTAGNVEHYSCSKCNKMFSNSSATTQLSSITVNATGHSLTYHKAVSATCTTAGNVAYYSCSKCNKNYSDSTAKTVIANVSTSKNASNHSGGTIVKNAIAAGDEKEGYTGDTCCKGCGAVLSVGSPIPAKNNYTVTISLSGMSNIGAICVDGVDYPVTSSGTNASITLKNGNGKLLVAYSYNSLTEKDVHKIYPTAMYVWALSFKDGKYTATRVTGLDNALQYAGSSIRITGKKGIRMITSVPLKTKSSLTGNGISGYTLVEYGTLVAWATDVGTDSLTFSTKNVKSAYAYKKGVSDPVYKTTSTAVQYTNVLVGFSNEQCKADLVMRPYMKLKDASGNEVILYGGSISRSIGYIAYQNRNAFSKGTDAYNFIWSIINYVGIDKFQ